MVTVPQPVSLEIAIRLYYEKSEIGNPDIRKLFGKISTGRIVGLKNLARELMIENKCRVWNPVSVNTKLAYKSWGLDIKDLEERYARIKKLERIA